MNNSLEMRDQNINKLLWKFSLPAIIAMLVNALYNISLLYTSPSPRD